MDYTQILKYVADLVYVCMALAAIYGAFCVVLLVRAIGQKKFSSSARSDEFLGVVREELEKKNVEGIVQLCDSPQYWSKATPQMILYVLQNLKRSPKKLQQMVGDKFERDVLADLQYRTSWISTIVKSAPMLGLLGTVLGMINAFAKIASAKETGTDPSALANDISFALTTTALGLAIAIPLVLAGNMIHNRITKLQDSVQEDMTIFLDDLEENVQRA